MTSGGADRSRPYLIAQLRAAGDSYNFPPNTWDFQAARRVSRADTQEVESSIGAQLRSGRLEDVRDGLSNVLYWGYATSKGRQMDRVGRFRQKVRDEQILAFAQLAKRLSGPGLKAIAGLKLPQFSGVSFISKVRMFLDPMNYVVLDGKIARLRGLPGTILDGLVSVGTQIKVTSTNEAVYEQWSGWCRKAARQAFGEGTFAVRAERAVFQLVNQNKVEEAAQIIRTIRAS